MQGKAMGGAYALFLWCSAALPPLAAQPLGLQTGGVGDGYVFSAISDLEWQSTLSHSRHFGKATFPKHPKDRWSARSSQVKLENALSYRASPDFLIIGGWDSVFHWHKESLRIHPWHLKQRSPYHRIQAKAVFDRGSWILGGAIGFTLWDSVERSMASKEDEHLLWLSESSTLITPISMLSIGYQYSNFTAVGQLSLPHKGDRSIDASFPMGDHPEAVVYDREFEQPLRSSLHFLVDFDSEFQLAASLTYENRQSSSDVVNRWSVVFDEKGRRKVGGGDVAQDLWQISVGGRYFATADFSVSGSVLYEMPSYADTPYFEERHLGGFTTNFGVEFVTYEVVRLNLATSYQSETTHTFTYPHTTEDINRHQRLPFETPRRVKMSQGSYAFKVGISYLHDTEKSSFPEDS